MTWVKSISVAGLAGRDGTTTLDFNRDVNVLWGVNGCGKTSLLKILHGALRGDAKSLVRVPFESATVKFVDDLYKITHTRTLSRASTRRNESVDDVVDSPEDAAEYAQTLLEDSSSARWSTKPTTARRPGVFAHPGRRPPSCPDTPNPDTSSPDFTQRSQTLTLPWAGSLK
jgi:energy-coupling factor transporter ATP-binding protein EcfA2